MDMLRSDVFSISNPTPWSTIWAKPIYICLITKNHVFPIINGPILLPLSKPQVCENMFTTQNLLPSLHLFIQSNFSESMPHNDVIQQFTCFRSNMFCCCRCSFKSTINNESNTIYSVCKKLWTPSVCLSTSPPTSFLKCATKDWHMPTKATTLQVETPFLSCTKAWCLCSWDHRGIQLQMTLQFTPHVLWNQG